MSRTVLDMGFFFPRTFAKFRTLIVPDQCLALKGNVSIRNGEPSVLVEAVKEL